jgi:hypothetical protein
LVYRWALGAALGLLASLSAPNAEAKSQKVRVTDIYFDTEVTFEYIDSISRGNIQGKALSSSRSKGVLYSNNSGVMSPSESLQLKNVLARSLPDHCVTLASRAIGADNVLLSVTARVYTFKDEKKVIRPVMAMPYGVDPSEDIGELVGCRLISGSIARIQPAVEAAR